MSTKKAQPTKANQQTKTAKVRKPDNVVGKMSSYTVTIHTPQMPKMLGQIHATFIGHLAPKLIQACSDEVTQLLFAMKDAMHETLEKHSRPGKRCQKKEAK